MGKPRADYSLPLTAAICMPVQRAQVGRKQINLCMCFLCLCCCLQLHPELSALPQQHDGGGLHDGAGCRLPSRHRRPPRAQVSVPRRLPGKRRRDKKNKQTDQKTKTKTKHKR